MIENNHIHNAQLNKLGGPVNDPGGNTLSLLADYKCTGILIKVNPCVFWITTKEFNYWFQPVTSRTLSN